MPLLLYFPFIILGALVVWGLRVLFRDDEWKDRLTAAVNRPPILALAPVVIFIISLCYLILVNYPYPTFRYLSESYPSAFIIHFLSGAAILIELHMIAYIKMDFEQIGNAKFAAISFVANLIILILVYTLTTSYYAYERTIGYIYIWLFGCSSIISFAALLACGADEGEYIRGAWLSDAKTFSKSLAQASHQILLGDVPLPDGAEKLHSIIVASTGAGKSVALRKLLMQLRSLGDRVVVVDNGGEFYSRLGQHDDIVMAPLEAGWDLRNEIRNAYEWGNAARSVVPDGEGNAAEWRRMAQSLLADVGVSVGSECDNKKLFEILSVDSADALAPIVEGTASAVMLQEGGQKLLTNIRSVYNDFIKTWQFAPGGSFSFRQYMQDDSESRWLWIPFKESQFDLVRSMIATWIDVLVNAGLERSEGAKRTWVVIDELDTLGELSSLIAATTKLRKRNVCIVVACQSFSQLAHNYGEQRARTLLNCFSNVLVLRSVDAYTAEALSLRLGEQEFVNRSISRNDSPSQFGQGTTETTSVGVRRIVLASEIQNLPDLTGYMKPAGNYPAVKTTMEITWARD